MCGGSQSLVADFPLFPIASDCLDTPRHNSKHAGAESAGATQYSGRRLLDTPSTQRQTGVMVDPSFTSQVPAGDTLPRQVCTHCGFIHYHNPKIVVGVVATWEGKYLLCRRSIEPRQGFWTIPAGFMEENESTEEGAVREAKEEANAAIALEGLLAVYSIPRISQVQIIYTARLLNDGVRPGPESAELAFYRFDEIPWADLAFPSVEWSLKHHRELGGRTECPPFRRSL